MYKRVLLLILCFVMVFSVGSGILKQGFSAQAAPGTSIEQDQNDLEKLKEELNKIQGDKSKLESQKNEANAETQTLLQEKSLLEEEYSILISEKEAINKIVKEYQLVLDDIDSEKEIAQEQLDKQLDDFASLLVYMYKHGDDSKLKVFLRSESYAEYLSYVECMEHILNSSDRMIGSINATIDEIEGRMEEYKTAGAAMEEYLAKLEATEVDILAKNEEIEKTLAELEEQQGFTEEEIEAMERLEQELLQDIKDKKQEIQDKLDAMYSGSFSFPLIGWSNYRITSRFVNRINPITGKAEHHNGIDFACARGTAIGAVDAGRVTYAGFRGAFGNVVFIEHGGGITTVYAHCDVLLVSAGARVAKDQVIARVGTTGQSTGYHLHFSVVKNGMYVNPEDYLPTYYTRNYSYSR